MVPSTDPRDARIALLERLFQSAVGRADALEREVATLQEEKGVLQAAAERVEALEREIATLTEENAELRARLNLNSELRAPTLSLVIASKAGRGACFQITHYRRIVYTGCST